MKPLKAERLFIANDHSIDEPPGVLAAMKAILEEVQQIEGNRGNSGVPLAALTMLGGSLSELIKYCKLTGQNYDENPRPATATKQIYNNNPQLAQLLANLNNLDK